MLNTALLISEVLAQIPAMVALGMNVASLVSKIDAVISSESLPGTPEWDAVKAERAELSRQLNIDPPPLSSK